MSSRRIRPLIHSEAWGISLWATLAFAIGSLLVFWTLQNFVAKDIQRRSDTWLSGEVDLLGDVAGRTPKGRLYDKVVREVAELASREVPNREFATGDGSDSVFFLKMGSRSDDALWVGSGDKTAAIAAIQPVAARNDFPYDIRIRGFADPYRVASVQLADGSRIYLGLSERDELRVLSNLRLRFLTLWLLIVLLGFSIVFYTTWKMLKRVDGIAVVASHIGRSNLSSRVPAPKGRGEVGRLARTLNQMLDHIEATVGQLHTITDALAHDLKSPLTAIRGKLEGTLLSDNLADPDERVVSAIEDIDRLCDFLNTTLDVSEAKADALRLSRTEIDLGALVRAIAEFFEPSFSEKGCALKIRIMEPVRVSADAGLLHRVIANLLDNELKHLPRSSVVSVSVTAVNEIVALTIEDNGPGFDQDVLAHLFERRIKSKTSRGHGLGLAFVKSVVRVHGGSVEAENREGGGIRIRVSLPALQGEELPELTARALVARDV